eukprot:1666058-Amphidinium_carterae.1
MECGGTFKINFACSLIKKVSTLERIPTHLKALAGRPVSTLVCAQGGSFGVQRKALDRRHPHPQLSPLRLG